MQMNLCKGTGLQKNSYKIGIANTNPETILYNDKHNHANRETMHVTKHNYSKDQCR